MKALPSISSRIRVVDSMIDGLLQNHLGSGRDGSECERPSQLRLSFELGWSCESGSGLWYMREHAWLGSNSTTPAAIDVQIAKLAREHTELVLVVRREDSDEKLDGRVLDTQCAQPAELGDLDTVTART